MLNTNEDVDKFVTDFMAELAARDGWDGVGGDGKTHLASWLTWVANRPAMRTLCRQAREGVRLLRMGHVSPFTYHLVRTGPHGDAGRAHGHHDWPWVPTRPEAWARHEAALVAATGGRGSL